LLEELETLATKGGNQAMIGEGPTYVQSMYSEQPTTVKVGGLNPMQNAAKGKTFQMKIPQRNGQGAYNDYDGPTARTSRPSTARSWRPGSAHAGARQSEARITYHPDTVGGLTPRSRPGSASSRGSDSRPGSRATYQPSAHRNRNRPQSAYARTTIPRPPTAGGWSETGGSRSDVYTPRPPSTRPGSAVSDATSRPKTPRVEQPLPYKGRDAALCTKTVMIYSANPAYQEDLSKLVRSIGYRANVAGSMREAEQLLSSFTPEAGPHMVICSCDPFMDLPADKFVPRLRKMKYHKGTPVLLFADPEEAQGNEDELSNVLNDAISCGLCLSLAPPIEHASLKQMLQVACLMYSQSNGLDTARKTFRGRPPTAPSPSPSLAASNSSRPLSARSRPESARTPRTRIEAPAITYRGPGAEYVNPEATEAKEKEKKNEEKEENTDYFAISGYVGHVPGVGNHTYGKPYQNTIMKGPVSILPTKMTKQFPVAPDLYYPGGDACAYAKVKKNLRNRGSIIMGDQRTWDDLTTNNEFYKTSAVETPASQMMTWVESLPKSQLKQAYKKAEQLIGQAVIDGWEQDMRDKIQMYSSGGAFFIRRAFKYFDRDGSGSVDLDEFKFALDSFGMNLSDDQLMAFFGRYDEQCTAEISYLDFINKLLDEGSMYKETKKAVKGKIENLFKEDADQEPKPQLSEEEKQQQRPLVERMFKELDADCSGVLDIFEVRQLCNDLGLDLTDEQYEVVLKKLDEDGSGEVDFDEFFDWYVKN